MKGLRVPAVARLLEGLVPETNKKTFMAETKIEKVPRETAEIGVLFHIPQCVCFDSVWKHAQVGTS